MDYEFFGTLAAIVVASVAVFTFLLSIKNELREDLKDVREDMREMREDMREFREDMREMREDIRGIRNSVESLSERVARIEGLIIRPRELQTHQESTD